MIPNRRRKTNKIDVWAGLGGLLGRLGASCGRHGRVLGCLEGVLGCIGAALGPPWGRLGAVRQPSWRCMRGGSGASSGVLGRSSPLFGAFGARVSHQTAAVHLGYDFVIDFT